MTVSTTYSPPTQTGGYSTPTTWVSLPIVWGSVTASDFWLSCIFNTSSSDLTTVYDAERSLPLEPNLVQGGVFTAHWGTSSPASRTGSAVLYFVPELSPAIYSNSVNIGARSEVILGKATFTAAAADSAMTITLGASGVASSTDLLGPAGQRLNSRDHGNFKANLAWLSGIMNNTNWNGRICFSLKVQEDGGFPRFQGKGGANPPTFVTTEHSFHSGQMQDPKGRYRIRHDPKSGFPGNSKEFIEDGYTGLMVLPESFDPEDRTGQTFQPPSSEGVVDDEVP
jgi:hypothetical protein